VIGTRPEAIKLEPVARALAALGCEPLLIFTGQQRIDPADFRLDRYPRLHLDCPGLRDPHMHVRQVTAALLPTFADGPDLVVVQGDTSSALGGSLAAYTAEVPIAHVEAGLRTHDPARPWPEEEYRVAIDLQADLLFAPTKGAARNLQAEGVWGEIFVTGNSGIDALVAVESRLPPRTLHDSGTRKLLVTCHRRESWAEGLKSIAAALLELAAEPNVRIDVLLHPNEHVATSMRQLLGGRPNIELVPPCGYAEVVARMRDADLILSDSGGMQEEAPALGTPLLVLRDVTERPEAIASGNALLVGTCSEEIVRNAKRLLHDPYALGGMAKRALPFGDGHSGPRIAAIVKDWLERRHSQTYHAAAL
jgi:UDP-N-acetylglucosamine 2-epimerase (non-hydrolysing)